MCTGQEIIKFSSILILMIFNKKIDVDKFIIIFYQLLNRLDSRMVIRHNKPTKLATERLCDIIPLNVQNDMSIEILIQKFH